MLFKFFDNFLRSPLRKSVLKNASELTLGSDCWEFCFWTVAFKTPVTFKLELSTLFDTCAVFILTPTL